MITGAQQPQKGGIHGGHAAGSGGGGFGALKKGHAFLEHGNGGIALPAIGKAFFFAFKAGLSAFGGGIGKA
ncbi:hypothetical protein JCM17846_11130 [Iodidimonas nitroreducens]|uniref:Uncharacterized protein n=1 Tax=Iodidimonas nitroreducens TaxID=1236968 RepID=A0A5A7N582_9PROT|nr:hypothetical protein JCM17846_11130 [Iodidimonas nitroreducens]